MDSVNGDKKTIFMAQDPDFSMEDIDDLVFYDDGFPSLPDFPCLSSPSPDLNPSFAQSDSLVPAEFDVDEEIELDFWDPSLALQSSGLQQQQQQAGIEQNIGILDHEDLAKVFLDWLKNNRESISAADLRSIKLKRSTIESASRRLGRAQLLKLILSWVQNHHLQKKAAPFPQAHSKSDLSTNPVPIYNWCLQNPVLSPPHQMPSRMASANREARKRRMARHRKCCSEQRSRVGQQSLEADDPFSANNNSFLPADSSSSLRVPQLQEENHQLKLEEKRRGPIKTEKNLRFLLQKVLKQSDVGSLGRIVLPKKEAESHLPELDSRDGICIEMEDIGTSMVWNMRYRFWPNNKSRMYLLENTGDFVRSNELQEGDFIVIYSDAKCGKYMIRGVKVRQPLDAKYGKAHQKKKGSSFDDKKHKPPFMGINPSE